MKLFKLFFTLFLLIAHTSIAHADTIRIEQVSMRGPEILHMPYSIGQKSPKGETFDIQEFLKSNTKWIKLEGTQSLSDGSPILPASFDSTALGLVSLRFSLQTNRFAKVQLKVEKLKNYKIYVDEKEQNGNNLQLSPGRVEVALLALTKLKDKDSLRISLIGEKADMVKINTTDKKPYTMTEMIYGDHIYRSRISPLGTYIVTSYYNTQRDGKSVYRTVLTEAQSGRVILRHNSYVNYSWMPTREILYYTRSSANGTQLVTFNPKTGEEAVLAEGLPTESFTLSPTEDYIIYSKTEEGKKAANSLKLLQDPDDRMPGWRDRATLWMYDFKSGIARRLTYGNTSVALNDISSDGRSLLLSFGTMKPGRSPFHSTSIVRMNLSDGQVDTLINDKAFIERAKFSPDAQSLLITASPSAFDGIGCEVKDGQTPNAFDYRLYLYDITTKAITPLLPHFAPSVNNVEWSKTDGQIYFSATDGCDVSLFRLNPTTKRCDKYQLPVSCVQGYSIALQQKKPTVVFFGQTGERARELFIGNLGSTKPKCKRIGEINFDELYKDVAIGTCHDWKFQSSRGDSINGFYFLPPDFDASKKYPLIVYYYGGCTPTTKALEFQYPLQVLAGQGYVVYVCEPSGAIGYGQEFAARHVNTWGKESGDDIIEGTKQFLKEHTFVNPKKVGCMGASYGGFMTQYLQTRTDIFAAAISHAGISNIASYWGGGYWGYTYGEIAQYGSYPWNNPDLYVKQSPLFNADKINTPILLLHGTVDTNVPTNESQQLFTALRILGKPVSYIQIDGENHVITNHNKRLAWQNAIFAWFAHWLKDQPEWWTELYPEEKF
jgi:dipeptidyl aminopeptidase/acylaminoacyl peptidase